MTKVITPDQTMFESAYCTRCGGSGKFSFNLKDGNRCYGCSGSGVQLTNRGKAAKAFYIESQQMSVVDLKPGMFVWDTTIGRASKFLRILSIEPSQAYSISNGERHYYTDIKTSRGTCGVFATSKVRAVEGEEQRQAQIAAALAYQASLTKAGKPSKKALEAA